MNAIEFNSVWKKFKKGEKFNSIRDAVPNFFKKALKETPLKEGEFWAVKNVSFEIKRGEVVGVMGPNGAGKSTILKLLSRIIIPSQGDMKIKGRLSALIEVTAGFHPELTGRENVYLNGTILGMRKREIDRKFDEIVEFSGVSEFIDTPVKRYSSGMYSRLGFSVAAHMDPEILLVDEVLAVGDIAFQSKCAQKMRELMSSGATIILVSHQLNLIQSICKRVILLQNGEVVNDGTVEEVLPHYQNLVYQKSEEDLRSKINSHDERVHVNTNTLVKVDHLSILSDGQNKEKFQVNDPLNVKVELTAQDKIEEPIFMLEILRADGVLCCSTRTDEEGFNVETLEGKKTININLGKILLSPGIYMVKFSVWDKEMIHPYVVYNKEVFRIEYNGRQSEGLFFIHAQWDLLNGK